jgi:hypothetical protein
MNANQEHAQDVMRRFVLFAPLVVPALVVAFSDRGAPVGRMLGAVGGFVSLFLLFAGLLPEVLARRLGRVTAARQWRSAALYAGLLASVVLIPQVLLWLWRRG